MSSSSKSLEEAFAQVQTACTRALEVRKAAGQPYERYGGPMYEMDGIWMNSGIFPREAVKQVPGLEPRGGDVMIATYPRCGEMMLYHAFK